MSSDLINGLFEFFGGLLYLVNVERLWREKKLAGVHWTPTLFFTAWGLWNLYFYPHLHQWFSFSGGLFLVTVNAVWTSLAIYYSRKAK